MSEGNTAKVKAVAPPLRTSFNAQASRSVIKEFKNLSGDGGSTLPDFANEVAVLNILEKYQDHLPFKIPRIDGYGRYMDAAEGSPVAFIKMTRLSNSLSNTDKASLTPEMKLQHAAEAGKALAKLHALKLTPEEQRAIPCSPIQFNLDWLARRGKPIIHDQSWRGFSTV